MINKIRNLDIFTKNIILVFFGTSLLNFFNLLYQLLVAHNLSPVDFASFNSLLSVFVLVSSPLMTLQTTVIKFVAEFNAKNQIKKIQFFLSTLLKKTLLLALISFFIFFFVSLYLIAKLKIISDSSLGLVLAVLIAQAFLVPILNGGLQGLELFKWFVFISVSAGALKLILIYILGYFGLNLSQALAGFLVANLIGIFLSILVLRRFISFEKFNGEQIKYKEIFLYIFPVALTTFCFMAMVNLDMVLVKYFFQPMEAGFYSLAQMVGKIFLFLPAAIAIVLFPKTSGLKAKNLDTAATLKVSLGYGVLLCLAAGLSYNFFPGFFLKILTGKIISESISLARFFSISMTFFALISLLINYFLSIKDFRFIKYLVFFTFFQALAIIILHKSLIQVQGVLCINSSVLLTILLFLVKNSAFKKISQ